MSELLTIFQYTCPVLVVAIGAVLLCLYLCRKERKAAYDLTTVSFSSDSPSIFVIPISERGEESDTYTTTLPPRYSTVGPPPPPYHLFDPKLRAPWPETPPPAYEVFPTALPSAP